MDFFCKRGEKMSQNKKECQGECGKLLDLDKNFYKTRSKMFPSGCSSICKKCIKDMIDYDNMKSIYDVLRQLDISFICKYWNKAVESKKETFGIYVTMANSLPQFEGLTWEDSVFEDKNESKNKVFDNIQNSPPKVKFEITEELIAKWGEGYEIEEYRSFERKYNMLKNHYQEKTAMHTEALITYIRYRVKEELATSGNRSKEAKEWGTMAKEAATAAKINPSQLSKSDLSDGLDTFGQLVRTVEQAVDIIPILPQFKERPHDKPDFTMWCYINYIRDLKGLPLAEYDEIYRFYEERVKEYEDRFEFLQDGDE
jgi:hypothetical protein